MRPSTIWRNGSGYPVFESALRPSMSMFGISAASSTLHALDDGCGAHSDPDAQGHERGAGIAPLHFIDRGTEKHGAGGAKRMAHRNGAAIDVDSCAVEIEKLHEPQHHGGERLVDLEQVAITKRHATPEQNRLGDVARAGQR